MALSPAALVDLQRVFAADALRTDPSECLVYGYDNSRRQAMPDAVVFPTTHEQVLALVRACRAHRLPLVARGRGTNTTGASVPVAGGVVASFERMNRLLRIAPDDRLAVVEPGLLNGDLQAALAPHRLFWPPDPTSAPFCSIAGNIACNAGGPRAVKYGATRDNVLALRAVAGNGEEFRCGTPTTKGATGYDLTRLLIGSEGTLAVVTEATLKLVPLPSAKRTLRATYVDVAAAAHTVSRIMAQPVAPCALEFLDDQCLRLARAHGGEVVPLAGAMLLVEVDGEPDALAPAVEAGRRGRTRRRTDRAVDRRQRGRGRRAVGRAQSVVTGAAHAVAEQNQRGRRRTGHAACPSWSPPRARSPPRMRCRSSASATPATATCT
jgi:D-lactate dehydrogenase